MLIGHITFNSDTLEHTITIIVLLKHTCTVVYCTKEYIIYTHTVYMYCMDEHVVMYRIAQNYCIITEILF